MKQNNIDRLIKEAYTEFNSELDIHSDIKIPEFTNIMNKFHGNLKEKSNRSSIKKQIALVASFTLIIIFSTFLSSIPKVVAFKFNIIKSFSELRGDTKDIKFSTSDVLNKNDGLNQNESLNKNSNNSVLQSNDSADQIEKIVTIDEAKKEVPFKLLVPKYIPEDYNLKTVKLVKAMGDFFSVNQTYTNSTGKIIGIYQSTVSENGAETISMSSNLRTEDIIINNLKIKFATDDKNFKTMIWFDNNIKNDVLMPYNFTDTQMKRIIGLLK
jgi:phage regulator Rha-like protein